MKYMLSFIVEERAMENASPEQMQESLEQLGGFALLGCENLDDALEWARRVPMQAGSIEVRPVMDLSRFGYESRTVAPAGAG